MQHDSWICLWETTTQVFSCEIYNIFKKHILKNICGWLLLNATLSNKYFFFTFQEYLFQGTPLSGCFYILIVGCLTLLTTCSILLHGRGQCSESSGISWPSLCRNVFKGYGLDIGLCFSNLVSAWYNG